MSRYELPEHHTPMVDSQRGRYDSRQLPHSLASEHRSSLVSPTGFSDYQRTLSALHQQHDEFGVGGEGWPYPQPEQVIHATSLDALWTRPTPPLSSNDHFADPNRCIQSMNGNATNGRVAAANLVSPFNHNHHHRAHFSSSSLANGGNSPVYSLYANDFPRDTPDQLLPQHSSTTNIPVASAPPQPLGNIDTSFSSTRGPLSAPHTLRQPTRAAHSTLWWGELEPWMDEEYAKQVGELMGWEQVTIKIPHAPADPVTGKQANNPGYCFLTFPSPQHAATVLAQINGNSSGTQPILPNSTKPFVLNWASSPSPGSAVQSYPPSATVENPPPSAVTATSSGGGSGQKEYSIFVGDLAPETSNSDLVAVFRNPVLGLRNDRAPKFIRPFYSCKSAKIMLDPLTGVSRGYGFVRFTDEPDQQRALIEMHGLYCLSRPSEYFIYY